ncbi:MAG: hypothetical protein PHD01_09120 [Geobacteraceae bacterium]|nr:hypothetical protein [Geobacteraceae bacterium]
MQRLTLEQLPGRAAVHIYLRIIKKLVIGKDGTFLCPLECGLPWLTITAFGSVLEM